MGLFMNNKKCLRVALSLSLILPSAMILTGCERQWDDPFQPKTYTYRSNYYDSVEEKSAEGLEETVAAVIAERQEAIINPDGWLKDPETGEYIVVEDPNELVEVFDEETGLTKFIPRSEVEEEYVTPELQDVVDYEIWQYEYDEDGNEIDKTLIARYYDIVNHIKNSFKVVGKEERRDYLIDGLLNKFDRYYKYLYSEEYKQKLIDNAKQYAEENEIDYEEPDLGITNKEKREIDTLYNNIQTLVNNKDWKYVHIELYKLMELYQRIADEHTEKWGVPITCFDNVVDYCLYYIHNFAEKTTM